MLNDYLYTEITGSLLIIFLFNIFCDTYFIIIKKARHMCVPIIFKFTIKIIFYVPQSHLLISSSSALSLLNFKSPIYL